MKQVERTRLPVACPNSKCGATGWIPINRLDRQLVCRECGARFYMDRVGQRMVLGERPSKFEDPFVHKPTPRAKRDLPERIFDWWFGISPETKKILKWSVRVAVLAIILVLSLRHYIWPGPKLPSGLQDRALFVVKAVASENLEKLVAISASGSEKTAKEWMHKARPSTWPKKNVPDLKVEVLILYEKKKNNVACVRVDLDSSYNPLLEPPADASEGEQEPNAPPRAAQGEGAETRAVPGEGGETEAGGQTPDEPKTKTVSYTLFWSYVDDWGWYFDVEKTLKTPE